MSPFSTEYSNVFCIAKAKLLGFLALSMIMGLVVDGMFGDGKLSYFAQGHRPNNSLKSDLSVHKTRDLYVLTFVSQ